MEDIDEESVLEIDGPEVRIEFGKVVAGRDAYPV